MTDPSKPLTSKQAAVLAGLADGQSIDAAMSAAGVSHSTENRNAMLRRLIDAGYLRLETTSL